MSGREKQRRLVKRGGALCMWNGEKYERVFAAKRGKHGEEIARQLVLLRVGFGLFDDPRSGMDAPDLLPAGSMKNGMDGGFGIVSMRSRGGEK